MGKDEINSDLERRIKDVAGGHLGETEVMRLTDTVRQHIEANYMPLEKISELIVAGRLEELRMIHPVLQELTDADTLGEITASEALLRMIEHVSDRRRSIKSIAARRTD